MIKLAALVRAHKRADTLRVVLSELQRYNDLSRDLGVEIFCFLDRAPPEVVDVADEFPTLLYDVTGIPILGDGHERFLKAQNAHLSIVESRGDPDWVYVVDDDFWFEPRRITTELVPALSNPDVDAYYCPCVFMQDAPNTYNPDRQHESIRLYRHVPRARFSGKRMLSMPDGPHDEAVIAGRTARFPVPLLEYGGYTPEARAANIEAYARAGKNDRFTQALNSPRRRRFPEDWDASYGPWTSLYPNADTPPRPTPCAAPSTPTTSAAGESESSKTS